MPAAQPGRPRHLTSPNRSRSGYLPRLAAAQAAAARGWPVFPLHPYSKRPAITAWETRASTDPDRLARWWAHAPYNIGIACGPAGLLVVDLDTGHHQAPPGVCGPGIRDGPEALALLANEYGQPDPVHTYTVATPAGGEHRYFDRPAGLLLRNTAGRLGRHIDTRAAGGFVVAAGSVRRTAGHLRSYRISRHLPPAPLPGWLATAAAPPPAVATVPPPQVARPGAYARAAIAGETARVVAAATGTRNHTLFTAAARLGRLTAAGILDDRTAAAALLTAAQRHVGVDGFTRAEAHRTIASGLSIGARQRQHRP